MKIKFAALSLLAFLMGAAPALAQQSNTAGDASNSQQNGDNTQTKTGGQPGGASDRN